MFAVRRAVTDAFWGMCAADSLSMPVHWFYDVDDIQREFRGWIREFRAPRDKHPSSIMSLSNTGNYILMILLANRETSIPPAL